MPEKFTNTSLVSIEPLPQHPKDKFTAKRFVN